MTAEIAIMNKEAVALAADSAVTALREKGQKVFPSANKLFCLSKYQPVGIMIYGSASLMGIPWETIIRMYRKELGDRRFSHLELYGSNFITFLEKSRSLFPASEQQRYVRESVEGYFLYRIKNEIQRDVQKKIAEKGSVSANEVKKIASGVIKGHFDILNSTKNIPSIPVSHIRALLKKYRGIFASLRREQFEKLPMTSRAISQLNKIAAFLFAKDFFAPDSSGVVVAGFGLNDIFPSLRCYYVEGIAAGRLKYKANDQASTDINFSTTAAIIPFAQSEMVATFIEGVDPLYRKNIEAWLAEIFANYPDLIAENLNIKKRAQINKIKNATTQLLQDYRKKMEDYRNKRHVIPVINIVSILPKDELAAMAESLVNLTSFKRRVSEDVESVGGPIDVALISKGDGFIWISRKRYFNMDLNPRFFAKYFREVAHAQRRADREEN